MCCSPCHSIRDGISISVYATSVDDYNFVRHPPGHGLSESTCVRDHELGVPMIWVCHSSLRLRWIVVCPYMG
jgi:hypothetical protein